MSLLHPTLIYGLGLIALPVLLHFLMRQKPKRMIFPALRLIQQRRTVNAKRFRLRHVWLLLLRMLAIGGLVLVVARPSLPAADYSLTGSEFVTLGSLIVGGVIAGIAGIRWLRRRNLPRHLLLWRQSAWRGGVTALTLLLLSLLVAWPYQRRISAALHDPGRAPAALDLPVAGVLVFDTSLSMKYQQRGQNRLQVAKKIALKHLEDLPPGSRIAVAETANDHPILFQSTLLTAQGRIDAIEIQSRTLPLEDRLRSALQAHSDDLRRTLEEQSESAADGRKDRFIRRVYLFTDLSATAWRLAGIGTPDPAATGDPGGGEAVRSALIRDLEKWKSVGVYLIDVGEEQPQDLAITEVVLSKQRIPEGGDLAVAATIQATGGEPAEVKLELLVDRGIPEKKPTGKKGLDEKTVLPVEQMIIAENKTVKVIPGKPQRVEFQLVSGLRGPFAHGLVRFAAADPLDMDDGRFFTVEVATPPKILVVAPALNMAREWLTAFSLDSNNKGIAYAETFLSTAQFSPTDRKDDRQQLSQYGVICLINVKELSDQKWEALGKYVAAGGGLAIFLGSDRIEGINYRRGQAQSFLPVQLDVYKRAAGEDGCRLSIDKKDHPLFRRFKQLESYGTFAVLENEVFVSRFWQVKPANGATVLATFTNQDRSPALIERQHEKGRTLVLATGVDLPEKPDAVWSTLAKTTETPWLFLMFKEQLLDDLARTTDRVYNHTTQDEVFVTFEPVPEERPLLLQARPPVVRQTRKVLPPAVTSLSIRDAELPGQYDLVTTGNVRTTLHAFSVNPSAAECNLTRLTRAQLDQLAGPDRLQVARSIEELKSDISTSDLGKEVTSLALLALIVCFCGEHFVANRFYDAES